MDFINIKLQQTTQPNPPNQLVAYTPNNNPNATRGMQGDPSQGTWSNNGQQHQPNGPNTYFDGSAADPSRGALELRE
jgi:hypothetical protein